MPSFNLVAQLAHFGWGGFIVSAFALFGAEWYGLLGLAAYAALKEFVFDYLVEGQTFKNNALDFSLYMAGGLVGIVLGCAARRYAF